VTLRSGGREVTFPAGEVLPLAVLSEGESGRTHPGPPPAPSEPASGSGDAAGSFWEEIHALETSFQTGQERADGARMTAAILELDRRIWTAARDLEAEEVISQARELLREWVVLLGAALPSGPDERCLRPVMDELLRWRDELRRDQRWQDSDELRNCLQRARVVVEDTPAGTRWHVD
jgi:cysteinyl-tRNA synthetase